jgi:internalin A
MSELAKQLITENKRTQAKFLDLGGCGLTKLPPELLDCTWLENLNLGTWYYDEEKQKWEYSKNQGELNQIKELRGIESLKNLHILSFSFNQVTDISPVKDLVNLQNLYFYNNQVADISPVKDLVNLQKLDFSSNQVTDISPVKDLINLQNLYFSSNQVTDISPVKDLINLQKLDFGRNQVADISPVKDLVNLKELSFSSNQVTDISPVKDLINLQKLDFSSERLSYTPPSFSLDLLKKMINSYSHKIQTIKETYSVSLGNISYNIYKDIQNLISSENRYSSLSNQVTNISPLKDLVNLQELRFTKNQVSDIYPLKYLVNLQKLDFSKNQVSAIYPLKYLVSLEELRFTENQVSDISSLKDLVILQELSFDSNIVTDISPVKGLVNLERLSVYGNPVHGVPIEKLGRYKHDNCLPALKDYFQSIANKDFRKELNEAKLIIVGVGEVGKSELVEALSEPEYVFVEGRETTRGIRIKNWTLKNCQKQEKSIDFQVNIWDFAGQEINYGTHQFFLTKNSVYVFVWETRKGEEESKFAYWLSVVSLLSENAPVFVVQNKTDIYTSDINQADWKSKFPNIVEFYKTSCKNGSGIEKLRTDIQKALLALPHTFEIWNKDRYAIRESLEQSAENYISHKEYLKICAEKNLTTEQAGFLSKQLHDIGVVLHYPHDIDLKNTVVLKPEWATQAAYCLLLDEKYVKNGKFSTKDLENIWAEEKFDEKHPFLLGLMKKFELVFQFQESEMYILPERLPVEQPPHPLPLPRGEGNEDKVPPSRGGVGVGQGQKYLRFEYHYDFMPKGIISRFICRMHELIKEELFWKYGVVLHYQGTEAVVVSSEVNKQIRIEVFGKEADKLLAMIRRDFESIHEKLKNPKLKEKVPCVCPDTCEFKNNPYLHDYQTLKNFQAKGKKTRECEKSAEDIEIATLLEGILDTKKVGMEYLLSLIDENKIPEFYQELDRSEVSSYEINRLQKEFIYNGGTFQYADQLKVWVMNYFKQGRF